MEQQKGDMNMERMVAYCGLVCTECKGYLATQANDEAMLIKLAEQAIKDFGAPPTTTAESVMCDGCLSESARKCGYCAVCEIRACGAARGVANCAVCDDYGCAKITAFIGNVPEAKATLEAIRAGR
jgi:hypothetical protein